MRRTALASLLLALAASTAANITGAPCDPTKFERGTAFELKPYAVVDLNTLPSPLNDNRTSAGIENFCCLYCVRDSRCRSWTLTNGHICSVHTAAPGSRRTIAGAVSGTPLPRVPDIPADPQAAIKCLSAFNSKGKYSVTRKVIGGTGAGEDTCIPCWKPQPAGAKYLMFSPSTSTSSLPGYVWMPAEGQSPAKYTGALEHIASHGFVVVAPYVDYSTCRSNLCNATGAIYRNNSYPPTQKFQCRGGQCVPSSSGDDGATCVAACGALQPKEPLPDTTCTVAQVAAGEGAVRYVLKNHEALNVDATVPIGIGGASATAPQAFKVVSHLTDDEAAHVGAVVLQHPSQQASHVKSLDAAFEKFRQRATAGKKLPAMLAVSGYLCTRLGPCAAILFNKPCRIAAATDPPDTATLAACGDCTSDAGKPVAWDDFVVRYTQEVRSKVASASVAGPWHHWAPQAADDNPIRQGCGSAALTPETSVVIAWLTYALKGDASALASLRGCDKKAVSYDVDDWLLPRLDEDRLRNTPAGQLIENAIARSGTPITLDDCHIAGGRVATHLQVNATGVPDPSPTPPPRGPTPAPRPPPPPTPASSYEILSCDTQLECLQNDAGCEEDDDDFGDCLQTGDGGSVQYMSCTSAGLEGQKYTTDDCSGSWTKFGHKVGVCFQSSSSGKYIKRKCVY